MKKSEDPSEIIVDICTLINEVRTTGLSSNREDIRSREGVHCPGVLTSEPRHHCNVETQCGELLKLKDTIQGLDLSGPFQLNLDAIGYGLELRDGKVGMGNSELLLERWNINIDVNNFGEDAVGKSDGKMLIQAVHSHLHFSQISAWLSSSQGLLPSSIKYRISDYSDFEVHPDTHKFPRLTLLDDRLLTVTVHSLPRRPLRVVERMEDRLPSTTIIPTPVKSPTSCSQQANFHNTAPTSISFSDEVCVVSTSLHDSGIYSPGPVDRFYRWATPPLMPRYKAPTPRASPKARKRKALRPSLLGSFEESMLRNRFTPAGLIQGFKFRMSASGLSSSPSVSLPFTAQYYNYSEAPSPYTGCISLSSCGTHGYQIPRQGRIQATILDPDNNAIRIFLVSFDVRDMPPRCHTFLRHRVYSVNEQGKKSLMYHIHFRLISGRSSRVYLHTDVRVLFTRRSVDSSDLGVTSEPGCVVENLVPHNPRYSTITRVKKHPSTTLITAPS